ncbi:transcription factor IIIA-like [Eucyclogobius newberryi]|uniref:transcription factor IIIA-like n=1 Tax=Eucyclogobius newberryi TaxID=166745 RepID=UPI003B5A1040
MEVKPQKHKRFFCSFPRCDAAYNKQWKLDTHLCKHTGVKPHTCGHEGCGKSFSSPYHLTRHHLTHSGHKPFHCPEDGCGEAFTTNSNMVKHVKRLHGGDARERRMYVCEVEGCGLEFRKNNQLKSHMCERHQGLPPHRCSFQGCTMRFSFPNKLRRHEKVHRGYPCGEEGCAFVAAKWTEYTAHRREQHPPRFDCDRCGKTFKDRHSLQQHQRVHADTRLVLRCPRGDCGRTYTTPFNLQSHIQSFHEELRPFTCPHPGCGRSFAMKQSLTRHGVIHDPERKKIRKPQNKRSLASKLSGFKDLKRPDRARPGPGPGSGQGQTMVQTPAPWLNPDPGCVRSVAHGPSPGRVQDSVELVSLLQDTSLLSETPEHVSKSLSARVTA